MIRKSPIMYLNISVKEGMKLEKVKISILHSYSRRPSAFSNRSKPETDSKSSRSKADKHSNDKVVSDGKSNTATNMTSVASKVSPPAMSPSRPQQTFYFGQVQEKVNDEATDRKPSAVDKVNKSTTLILYTKYNVKTIRDRKILSNSLFFHSDY